MRGEAKEMCRYIALIYESTTEQDKKDAKFAVQRLCEAHPDWNRQFEDEGLLVLQSGTSAGRWQSYLLDDGGGIVLGKLFRRQFGQGAGHSEVSLGGRWSREIVKSGGRRFVQDFWGRYVAFVRDDSRSSTFVLRDPSGGVFCFGAKVGKAYVYFSHIVDVARTLGLALSVDWEFVLDSFLDPEYQAGATGFREIREIVPGECHEIGTHGLARHLYWDPCKIGDEGAFTDVDAAGEAVKNATESCVDAWVSTYDSIIHNLSGGLDSAIVLTCLAKSPRKPRILCINYYGEAQDSDERFFARKAAEAHGCDFTAFELPYIGRFLNRLIAENQMWPRPTVDLFGIPSGRIKMRLAQERGADVFTSGEGGDHLFFKTSTSLIAADYAYLHGLNRNILKISFDAARMLQVSFWSVLGTSMRYGLLRQAVDLRDRSYLIKNSVILESVAQERFECQFMHPWMENTYRLPNAKLLQISALSKVITRYPSFGVADVADVVHPLLSQPVMEACIRTPAYMSCLDGRDRGLARRVFSEGLPREILYRKSKGRTSNRYSRMFFDNIDFLREFILDGILVRQPFVNRRYVEGTLTVSGIAKSSNLMQVVGLVAKEAWLRKSAEATP